MTHSEYIKATPLIKELEYLKGLLLGVESERLPISILNGCGAVISFRELVGGGDLGGLNKEGVRILKGKIKEVEDKLSNCTSVGFIGSSGVDKIKKEFSNLVSNSGYKLDDTFIEFTNEKLLLAARKIINYDKKNYFKDEIPTPPEGWSFSEWKDMFNGNMDVVERLAIAGAYIALQIDLLSEVKIKTAGNFCNK